MSERWGRVARGLGLSILDFFKSSAKERDELETYSKKLRFYQRVPLDLADARDNQVYTIYGDIIAIERTTGTLDIRLNEVEADIINLNRVRKVYSRFWRFYVTNPAQVGLEAVLLIGRDALFDIEGPRAVALIDVLGGDINPATEDKQDTLIAQQISTTPVIYNVTMTNADTEYSQALPAGTKRFSAQIIEVDQPFRLAYVTGKVATPTSPWYTNQKAKEYYEDTLLLAAETLYFACSDAGNIVQIIAWT